MSERKAVYYGQVELIPGVICDGYVLDDDTAVMSERGTAELFGMHHKSLQSMAVNSLPKVLKPFIDNGWSMAVNSLPKALKSFIDNGWSMAVNSLPKALKSFIDKGSTVRGNSMPLS